jgi:hypothetical protein
MILVHPRLHRRAQTNMSHVSANEHLPETHQDKRRSTGPCLEHLWKTLQIEDYTS